jgi:hypothetical protein
VTGEAAQIKNNRAEADGFVAGAADGAGFGVVVPGSPTTAPTGSNVARGNDDPADCFPALLC